MLMTSLALVFGVLPLAIATGPGAGSQNAIGRAVVGGALSATFLAIFFVPLFFVFVKSWLRRDRPRSIARGAARSGASDRLKVARLLCARANDRRLRGSRDAGQAVRVRLPPRLRSPSPVGRQPAVQPGGDIPSKFHPAFPPPPEPRPLPPRYGAAAPSYHYAGARS